MVYCVLIIMYTRDFYWMTKTTRINGADQRCVKKSEQKIKHAQAKRYKLSGGSVRVVRAELTSLLTT